MLDLRGAILRAEASCFAVLEAAGFVHPEYLKLIPGVSAWDYGKTIRVPRNLLPAQNAQALDIPVCPSSGLVLRNYQVEAVRFAYAACWCAVIGLDVGLGKTLVALMAHALSGGGPFLVVGPLIAAGAWVGPHADPALHFDLRVAQLRTRDPATYTAKHLDELRGAHGYFINHEILADWQMQLSGFKLRTVIVDESHLLRGGKTSAAQAFRAVVRVPTVRTRLALSATPVVNKVVDLWSQLDFVEPDAWGWWGDFATRYQSAHPTEYTRYALGEESNVGELRDRLAGALIRRSRFQVRKELPAFERQLVALAPADLDAALIARYRDLEEDFKSAGNPADLRGLTLQQMTAMAGVLAAAKRPFACQEAESLAYSQGAVVVFTWFKETAEVVAASLRASGVDTYGPVDSDTSKAKRDKAADHFRDGVLAERKRTKRRAPLAFVATIGCAGMSMNQLAVSPCGLCCELYWVPATLLQMEGRVHREGQLAAACFMRYLYVRGTIDELMLKHLQHKARAIERATDDPEALSLCEALGGSKPEGDLAALCAALLRGADDAGEVR